MTIDEKLDKVTTALLEVDVMFKRYERMKTDLRQEFFDLATEKISSERVMEQRSIHVDEIEEEAARAYCAKHFPDYLIQELRASPPGFDILLEQRPEFIKFEHVNQGKRFVRQVAFHGAAFDAEAWVKEHEDYRTIIREKTVYELDEKAAQDLVAFHPELVPALQRYSSPGKPVIKLASIKDAKEEE